MKFRQLLKKVWKSSTPNKKSIDWMNEKIQSKKIESYICNLNNYYRLILTYNDLHWETNITKFGKELGKSHYANTPKKSLKLLILDLEKGIQQREECIKKIKNIIQNY